MPGIDGIQMLQKMKNDPHLFLIPVIILSSSSDNESMEQCFIGGAAEYL